MIRLHSVSIRNFRGIRELDLEFAGGNYAIQGPNGSGKSGVVDAIEFALTGAITRLSGPGTGDLSTNRHGPHVDYRDTPREAVVILIGELVSDGTKVTIERKLDRPIDATIIPDNEETRKVVKRVSAHPEFVLSRRQIIKYILVEAGKRAAEIQALLKLERINELRQALRSASGSCSRALAVADNANKITLQSLRTVLGIEDMSKEAILTEVNKLRTTAGVEPLEELKSTAPLDKDIRDETGEEEKKKTPSKIVALADYRTFKELFSSENRTPAEKVSKDILVKLEEVRAEPTLISDIEKQQLFDLALQYFDGVNCPVCDTKWDEDDFGEIVATKQKNLLRGKELKEDLLDLAQVLTLRIQVIATPLDVLISVSETLDLPPVAESLRAMRTKLSDVRNKLKNTGEILSLSSENITVLTTIDAATETSLIALESAIQAIPEDTGRGEARAVLIEAQARIKDAREANVLLKQARKTSDMAKLVLEVYDGTVDDFLNNLYEEVESGFAEFYRLVNGEDESSFKAQLRHSMGSVGLNVDFYGRGLFPPVAYHSEGHQDGMGLCLYLALMQKVLGRDFSFAVLDDVVMSVDSTHRKEVCNLLKQSFPETQFIITTHDKIWLHQMVSAGLVDRRSSIRFTRWSVDDGPSTAEAKEAWDRIQDRMDNDDVSAAAAILRRHLESASLEIGELIGAEVQLRQDADYELGEVLPKAISRWKKILKRAIISAKSWDNQTLQEELERRAEEFSKCVESSQSEQWALNKLVHYNAWASLSREDFNPLVQKFHDLLDCFRCSSCKALLHPEPTRSGPNTIRCDCGASVLNLVSKK
jgi:RecF/RecN/SMC N terminal domain